MERNGTAQDEEEEEESQVSSPHIATAFIPQRSRSYLMASSSRQVLAGMDMER
jgi:hypothetical protein